MKKSLLVSSTLVTALTLGGALALWYRKPIQAAHEQRQRTMLSLEAFVKFHSKENNTPVIYPQYWPADKLKDVICTVARDVLNDKITLNRKNFTELLTPLALMANKEHKRARQVLVALADNNHEKITELLALKKTNSEMEILSKAVDEYQTKDYMTLCQHLLPLIETMDIQPSTDEHAYKRGGYHSYYSDKKEEFSIESQKDWQNKQKNVHKILAKFQPKTVLDLGANRGWFSRLAQHLGASVIATDIDESCMDEVYIHAQENKLPIMSAIIPFEDCKKTHVSTQIKSDVVLCLALIHHLVFVAGFTLEQIFESLAAITENILIFEFVELDDEKVKWALTDPQVLNNPKLFKKAHETYKNYALKNYNYSTTIKSAQKYFTCIDELESHPRSRKLLVFKKNRG